MAPYEAPSLVEVVGGGGGPISKRRSAVSTISFQVDIVGYIAPGDVRESSQWADESGRERNWTPKSFFSLFFQQTDYCCLVVYSRVAVVCRRINLESFGSGSRATDDFCRPTPPSLAVANRLRETANWRDAKSMGRAARFKTSGFYLFAFFLGSYRLLYSRSFHPQSQGGIQYLTDDIADMDEK